jgi:hypothetical protein
LWWKGGPTLRRVHLGAQRLLRGRPAGFQPGRRQRQLQGPLSVTIANGRSTIEPGAVPAKNLTFTFNSFTDAANSAGMSRRYGGIHFEPGDLNGRTLGSQIGSQAWAKAQTYFNGTATS